MIVVARDANDRTARRAAGVRSSEARKVAGGGLRLPGSVLGAEPAGALRALMSSGYASTATGCIARAILDAWKLRGSRSGEE